VTFAFPVPPVLRPAQQYALVLSWPDAAAMFTVRTTVPGPCGGGQLFQSLSATAPFMPVTLPNGATFDALYRTVVSR
jgi:hypothetical protein